MVYISFYLLHTLNARTSSIAIIPCVMYTAGFIASMTLGQRTNAMLGRRLCYVFACAICSVGCALAYMCKNDELPAPWMNLPHETIFPIAILFGVGTSLLMVTGVSFVHDLVSDNLGTSAFVYGCMSLADKFGTGVVVILVQNHRDLVCHGSEGKACALFVRQVLAGVPLASCFVACLVLPFLPSLVNNGGKGKGEGRR